jgi:hypothetical protein
MRRGVFTKDTVRDMLHNRFYRGELPVFEPGTSRRIRYHCRSKAQGIGCTGSGSFLDVYERQLVDDLANFQLPADRQHKLLQLADSEQSGYGDGEQRRRQLETRLDHIEDLYG